jgi:hypothetical protein
MMNKEHIFQSISTYFVWLCMLKLNVVEKCNVLHPIRNHYCMSPAFKLEW